MKKRCTSGHVNGRRVFFMLLAAVGGGAQVKLERHAGEGRGLLWRWGELWRRAYLSSALTQGDLQRVRWSVSGIAEKDCRLRVIACALANPVHALASRLVAVSPIHAPMAGGRCSQASGSSSVCRGRFRYRMRPSPMAALFKIICLVEACSLSPPSSQQQRQTTQPINPILSQPSPGS
jgi:hypothetical protein